ncbi:hypothetical protein [uncultured Microbacterium sp.]|uniref:DUF3558 domain-containing protein n=1 Tax=uncultured Microbacterium sp. TaxID=191216 RepID=A0A1Y5PBV9_9MICO|nr:hypothetical protein [uncultured Microbacterium sp.]SBS73398.1 conserved exported hypothetical protein [uncultured Microbacterium sp.]
MSAPFPRRVLVAAPAVAALLVALLAACAPTPEAAPSDTPTSATPSSTPTPAATADGAPPVPSGPVLSMTVLPTDCSAILDDAVLAQLEGVPLNDPGFGETGVLSDRTLRCVWGQPGADTTRLETTINYAPENDVLDYFNARMEEGFVCYEPAGGLRCEKTWQNDAFPVTDGRTLFYRDGVLIDTQYSNLAPTGYTTAVIRAIWPSAL